MAISETAIVDWAVRDEYADGGKRRPPLVAAESYGSDTVKLLADDNVDNIRLQARCAFRFASMVLDGGW